jgi:hypothetical protein
VSENLSICWQANVLLGYMVMKGEWNLHCSLFCLRKVLKDYGAKDKLANKMMGEIDKEPWEPACRLRYRLHEEGWDIKMATQISKWEALLKDHSFRPLKMVEVTPNELKVQQLPIEKIPNVS